MSFMSVFFSEYARAAQLTQLKKGKTEDQKKAIDYLMADNVGCGCGGCLGKSGWKLQDYLNHVSGILGRMDLRARAIEKIGLDESEIQEIEPIVLSSFTYGKGIHAKYDEGVMVSNQYAVTWLFFSASQIYTYKYIFETTSDNVWEITHDFFYTDITCFTTQKRIVEDIRTQMTSKGCLKGSSEDTTKNNYILDYVEIDVPNTSFSFEMRNSENIERSIQAVKNMLRDKKYIQ